MNNKSIEELGILINARMKGVAGANNGIALELGVIGSNMALFVSSLGNAIPKGEYMIARHLTLSSLQIDTNSASMTISSASLETNEEEAHKHTIESHTHSTDNHSHTATLPDALRGLREGDRVLVAWVGTEPVVVDIVVSS